jgi:hypothetical protein
MKTRLFAILIIVAWSGSAMAKPAIYESHDAAGAVFSDEPSPAAQPMSLPPPNVIQTEQQSVQNKATPDAAAIYSSISIIFPADHGGVHTNTGAFDGSVQIEPELQVGRVTASG